MVAGLIQADLLNGASLPDMVKTTVGRFGRLDILINNSGGPPLARAQTATEAVALCLDKAADAFVTCVGDLPWYAESLCYSKYAADGILCVPANLFKFLVS